MTFSYIFGGNPNYISDSEGAADNSATSAGSRIGYTGMEPHQPLKYYYLYFRCK
jgi:hypothetical protein